MKRMLTHCCLAWGVLVTSFAFAHVRIYEAFMDGPSEFPPNASPGTGFVRVTVDLDLFTMRVEANFTGLVGTTTAAHIHGPIPDAPANPLASVISQTPSYPGFPIGVTSGSMDETFNMLLTTSYNGNQTFVNDNGGTAGAFGAFVNGLDAGKMYFNIHSTTFPGGEIRGFPTFVPEPSSIALIGLATCGVVARRMVRRARVVA